MALADAVTRPLRGVIDQVLVKGDALTELDFFHRPSWTLILTDLIENFEPSGCEAHGSRWLVRWSALSIPMGRLPLSTCTVEFSRIRKQVRVAVERMAELGPRASDPSHGRWWDATARSELRRAFRWVL